MSLFAVSAFVTAYDFQRMISAVGSQTAVYVSSDNEWQLNDAKYD